MKIFEDPQKMKRLTLDQYREIITVAMDHQLDFLRGKAVFDNYDMAVEQDRILRSSVENLYEQKNTTQLRKLLRSLISSFFEFQDKFDFAQYLFKKTGYQINPIPKDQICITDRREIYISASGKDAGAVTSVQVLLPTISGVIYCIRGSYPGMKAAWINSNTIEIEIPVLAEELERVNCIRYEDERINIKYKAPESNT